MTEPEAGGPPPIVSLDPVNLDPGPRHETREDRRDKVRERIAMLLLWLLIAEVAGIGLIFMFAEIAERYGLAVKWVDLKDLIGLVMTPTITLVGTALGFYFGAKAEAEKHRA